MINFLRARGFVLFFTLVWMIGAITLAVYQFNKTGSVFNYSIDFTGGTQIYLHVDQPLSSSDVQQCISEQFPGEVIVRSLEGSDLIIRIQEFTEITDLGLKIIAILEKKFPGVQFTLEQSESVGPGVGASLWQKSLQAILLSMIAILIYVGLRFWSFAFSASAVLSLLHDALIILALILFLKKSISVNIIGSIVAILGYSINDTIVIFSQIREYMVTLHAESFYTIINKAINKTLRRTMLTSISTMIPLTIMYFFGGEALNEFSFILLAGIIFGTFSSLFIATPLLLLFHSSKKVKNS